MASSIIKTVQQIPASMQEVWDFFSNPANLQQITPPSMAFKVISTDHGDKIYPGQIIEYKVKPLLGISWYWMTEITHVVDKKFFVDEQRFGPYQLWHHQHHFRELDGGVEMTDLVHYRVGYGFIGNIIDRLVVKRKLKEIFNYRRKVIIEVFNGPKSKV